MKRKILRKSETGRGKYGRDREKKKLSERDDERRKKE